MRRSEAIEKNFEHNFDDGWDYARLASMEYFVRLVEDLTDSRVVTCGYFEEYEHLEFALEDFEKWLNIDIYDKDLADCTKAIVVQTQDFLSENVRKDL